MTAFFQQLHAAMRDGEQFKFQVTREGDRLAVMIQPLLGAAPEDIEDDEDSPAAQARAALATPLLVRMTPAELDQHFGPKLTTYGEVRGELTDSYQTLIEDLKDSSKRAQKAVQDKKAGAKAPTKSLPKPEAKKKPEMDGDDDADDDGAAGNGKTSVAAGNDQPGLPLEPAATNPASIL